MLTKPVLNNAPAFDATTEFIFTFAVPSGGDQVTRNRLTIIDQSKIGRASCRERV